MDVALSDDLCTLPCDTGIRHLHEGYRINNSHSLAISSPKAHSRRSEIPVNHP